jgi:hypothetical protein
MVSGHSLVEVTVERGKKKRKEKKTTELGV